MGFTCHSQSSWGRSACQRRNGLVAVCTQDPLARNATKSLHEAAEDGSCECAEPSPLPDTGYHVGIKVGLKTFATLSAGVEIANLRFFRHEEQALARTQHRLSKEEKGAPTPFAAPFAVLAQRPATGSFSTAGMIAVASRSNGSGSDTLARLTMT